MAAQRLSEAEWLAWPELRQVFAAFAASGPEVRAVGGAVRNTLLGRAVTEVDLATDAAPDTVMGLAAAAGLKTVPTGLAHGTVTLIAGKRSFEVTTLRHDVETFGRHATVAFTDDWAADASRRDFTINALYASADGELHDPLGGLSDLVARRVRFIGDPDERIKEDYLRILRFFRISAEYAEPPFDVGGLAACVRRRAGLSGLSRERVHSELMRLLVADGAIAALDATADHGLLVMLLGGVAYRDRFGRVAGLEAELGLEPDAVLRLAGLALGVEEDADRLVALLKLSNREAKRLRAAAGYRAFSGLRDEGEAKRKLYRAGADAYRDLCLLGAADAAESPDPDVLTLPERWPVPRLPVGGADLAAIGLEKGPRVGEVLAAVEAHWLAKDFKPERSALLAMAETLVRNRKED